MRSIIINKILSFIKKHNDSINDVKLAEVKYGLESIYILITKLTIIILIALLLGSLKETLWVLLFANIIRLFSFGVHATKSWVCLIVSIILFIGLPYACTLVNVEPILIYIIGITTVMLIAIYSPADTLKRPIRSKKRRLIFKLLSTIISITYYAIIIYFQDSIFSNYLLVSLIIQSIMIIPITYKAFGVPYNNGQKKAPFLGS